MSEAVCNRKFCRIQIVVVSCMSPRQRRVIILDNSRERNLDNGQ